MELQEVDVHSPDIWEQGVPHEALALLRKESPIHWHEEPGGRGYWVVTQYDHIVEISTNPQDFSSARGGSNIEDYDEEDLEPIRMLMVNMDPPQHWKFRKLVSRGFTPRMVRLMEQRISRDVDEILERLPVGEPVDFVREVAADLPLRVICRLIGVPDEDLQIVFDYSNRLIGFDDPEFQTSVEDARIAAMEVFAYGNELVEAKADEISEDLIYHLCHSEVEEGAGLLTRAEFNAFFLLISVAGNETTRNAITGGLLALLENPEQIQLLRDDPSLIDSATEEILRWVTPVNYFRRTVTRDLHFHGVDLKENDKVVMHYHAANRDPKLFPNPMNFDIRRSPNDHLAFGVGEHFCLGASLARMEIKLLFQELFKRFSFIEIAGPQRRLRSNFINGVKELPVRFTR